MTSTSRASQEKLQSLEKDDAPFVEQLCEAARFVGTTVDGIRRLLGDEGIVVEDKVRKREEVKRKRTKTSRTGKRQAFLDVEDLDFEDEDDIEVSSDLERRAKKSDEEVEKKVEKNLGYHGKEEWLLRWLLKRLQALKDDAPRSSPGSWWLLTYLLQRIPSINAAQILVERKFISILRLTLEEAQRRGVGNGAESDSSATEPGSPLKKSKKRSRSGRILDKENSSSNPRLLELIEAIFAALNCIVESTRSTLGKEQYGRSAAFIAEHMKTVTRTSAEESATILGLWLSLCQKVLSNKEIQISTSRTQNLLSPFVEIWKCHIADESQYLQFSLHSTLPALSLCKISTSKQTRAQLCELIARNIIVPAKTAFSTNAESDLLSSLTRIAVLQDSTNAVDIFDVAIRCIPTPSARKRRKAQDDTWLAHAFSTLKAAMTANKSSKQAIRDMLQLAIDYKVKIDLDVLRAIVVEYAFGEESNDWTLIATVLELDGNTFLIPDDKNLLQEVFDRITKESVSEEWENISGTVVQKVVVPLMREFARARDLTGFIKLWFAQLVQFEKLRNLRPDDFNQDHANLFGAWEDEAVSEELKKLFEPSLTIQQITQILDWLQSEDAEQPNAVCVVLEAIAKSISGDEHVVDAIGLRLYHIMFDNHSSETLDPRYVWRSWNVITYTLAWIEQEDIDRLSLLWEQGQRPFDRLNKKNFKHLFKEKNLRPAENLSIFSFTCAAWDVANLEKEDRMKTLVRDLIADMLKYYGRELVAMLADETHEVMGDETEYNFNTLGVRSSMTMGAGWNCWAFIRCLFNENLKYLELVIDVMKPEDFIAMLQNIFWMASFRHEDTTELWISVNPQAYPDIWQTVLSPKSLAYASKKLIRTMVDVMLNNLTFTQNPLLKQDRRNEFALQCLHKLRVEDFTKSQREQVLQSFPEPMSIVLDFDVLALKVKIMQHPAIYEGMRFKDLVKLADTLAAADELVEEDTWGDAHVWASNDISQQKDHLALLKELAHLTFVAIMTNPDQARNKTYISDAFQVIQKKLNKTSKPKQLNFAQIAIFEVAVVAMQQKGTVLDYQAIISDRDRRELTSQFKDILVNQLTRIAKRKDHEDDEGTRALVVISVTEALAALGGEASELAPLTKDIEVFSWMNEDGLLQVGNRMKTFMQAHIDLDIDVTEIRGDITTISGRESILRQVQAAIKGKDDDDKLDLLQSLFEDQVSYLKDLDKILAARYIISSMGDNKSQENESDDYPLAATFTSLAEYLPKITDIRQFCLISETMELMLKTKPHSMSQYNIDCTIGAVTMFCSPQAPKLEPFHATTIYTLLCRLLQTILMNHRLKIQGHSHLIQQAMQALIRCLFIPTNPSQTITTTKLKFGSPPPWLGPLTTKHAQHFAKLLLLVADPPLSTLSQGRSNPLVSLKDKAKRMSAQWTKFVMQEYIYMQLDMNVRMDGGVREALMQGWFAVLESMGESGRDAMRGEMDSGGRAVFRGLFEEWRRTGGKRDA